MNIDPKNIRRGDRVQVRHDDGELRWHEVLSAPWIRGGKWSWVLALKGISGCCALRRVVQHEPDMPTFVDIGKMLADKGCEFGEK